MSKQNQKAKWKEQGRAEAIEDEIKFIEKWLSIFWHTKNCACCECHKSKLQVSKE